MTNSGDEYECEIDTSGMTETSVERCVYVYQSGRVCGALQEATEHDPQGCAERWHSFEGVPAARSRVAPPFRFIASVQCDSCGFWRESKSNDRHAVELALAEWSDAHEHCEPYARFSFTDSEQAVATSGAPEPFSYWARVIDDAVGYLAKCENEHSGPNMMPLTVTLTAIAMHLRGMAAAPRSPERAKAHSLLDELIDALPNVAESTHVFARPGDGASNYAFERCKQIRVVALAAVREEAKRGEDNANRP